jgi:hypothetical protein
VARDVAPFHVDASASDVVTRVFLAVSNVETAAARDVFYFAAACVTAHYANRARYSVTVRRAVCAVSR